MPPDPCSRCEMAAHQDCVNGHVVIDDLTSAECPNMRARRQADAVRGRLTSDLISVKTVKESPLYIPKSADLTTRNLFINGIPWSVFRCHLKYVVMWKVITGKPFTYKVVDDQRLKEVFLGTEAYKSRPASLREQRETNNAIDDLVAESYDLVIIRLGMLAHKNSAAANVLREALMLRTERYNKPTWIFLSCDPQIVWRHSRDEAVEAYINARFENLTIQSDETKEAYNDIGIVVDGEEDAPEHEEKAFVPSESLGSWSDSQETDVVDTSDPGDFGMMGEAYQGDGKKSWKKGKRRF